MVYNEEIRLKGSPVSEGIAIGSIFFFGSGSQEATVPQFPITVGEIEEEIARYRRALFSSKEDLQKLQTNLAQEGSSEVVNIIDAHIQILDDPLITTEMEEKIRIMRQNTESVFRSVIQEYETRFCSTKSTFFQERLVDVMDVSNRILGHLYPTDKLPLSEIPYSSILFVSELSPSDTASLETSRVKALVTQTGGGNSHAALIARAKGVPYVANIEVELLQNFCGKTVIVDGSTGEVILNPSLETEEKYRALKKRLKQESSFLESQGHLQAETRDGHTIQMLANIGDLAELSTLDYFGAQGIGLFRSEYLLLNNKDLLNSEEEQFLLYKEVVEKMQGKPCVIRVFDLGGDKILPPSDDEAILGYRGIRYLLHDKDLFKIQLRALLRAAAFGPLKIMLPLVSDVEELHLTKQLLEEAKKELSSSAQVAVGCMIEVPAAVLTCDLLSRECDFFSIGTNDLMQYGFGIDRVSNEPDPLFPAHPAVIRMIQMIALEAKRSEKSLTICGEIATKPLFTPLLLGLGIQSFSCAPRYLPLIKQTIRDCSLAECKALAQRALTMRSAAEVATLLNSL